jgi:hypothetical protein
MREFMGLSALKPKKIAHERALAVKAKAKETATASAK